MHMDAGGGVHIILLVIFENIIKSIFVCVSMSLYAGVQQCCNQLLMKVLIDEIDTNYVL